MAKQNPHKDYTYSDRFQRFIQKLISFAISAKSISEIDNSPDKIFDGEHGELLVKYKEKIFYRKNDSESFVSLSDEYRELTESSKVVLSDGVNKHASWVKSSKKGTTDWQFLGYFSPICDVDCCMTGSSE